MWDATARALTDRPVHAPTMHGLGDSLSDWAAGVLEMIDPGPVIVVGNSVGGSCAFEVARLARDRVAGIVVIGGKADVRPAPEMRDEALALLGTEGLAAGWERYWRPLFGPGASPDALADAKAMALGQDLGSVVAGVRAFHDRIDRRSVASAWGKPLVGISGEHDVAPPIEVVRQLATGPNRRFHLVAGCGHYVPLEQPAEFQRLLVDAVVDIEQQSQRG